MFARQSIVLEEAVLPLTPIGRSITETLLERVPDLINQPENFRR
jgi:hypothetical protein